MSAAAASDGDLKAELDHFGARKVRILAKRIHDAHLLGQASHVSLSLALGAASVESDLRNYVSDGGHGRGLWQQDDRWDQSFLASTRGCRDGAYTPVFRSCLPKGRVPTLSAGAGAWIASMHEHRGYGINYGVGPTSLTRFALASYNAGPSSAYKGFVQGDVDRFTATGDYSARVLARAAVFHRFLAA